MPIPEPNIKDKLSANMVREILRAIRSLTPIAGHGMRISRGPNGTVYNAKTVNAKKSAAAAVLPWTFSCTVGEDEDGDETREGGWTNCRMQIGYDASFGDEIGQHLDLCKDGLYYAEVDLINETWDLKCIEPDEGGMPGKDDIPPHDFENSKINVFIGIVKDAVCTYSIHCIPVAYKYV